MFKKILAGILLLLSSLSLLKAQLILEMPTQFFVKQHWFSLTNTFDIETKGRKFGTVHRMLLSWTPQYLFYDVEERLHAKAKMRFFSWGATFDVWDVNEQPIGTVDERIFTFFPTFDLYRADGYHAAKAKLNFWGTKYTVRDPLTNEVIAYLWRNFFRLKDNWTVDIVNPVLFEEKQIDLRMFILVMAFQTDRDYWSNYRNYWERGNNSATFIQTHDSDALRIAEKNLEQSRMILESHREQLSAFEPTDQDMEFVEKLVERHLNENEWAINPSEKFPSEEMAQAQVLEQGISLLLPLLESDDLSPSQKSALLLLIDHRLN